MIIANLHKPCIRASLLTNYLNRIWRVYNISQLYTYTYIPALFNTLIS